MNLSAEGLDLIKSFEGYHDRMPDGSCRAYRCPAGVWTIGFGCTEGVHEGQVITAAEAESRLRAELTKHEGHVNRLVTAAITQPQFDALVSFCYNCGVGNLGGSTLLKCVNAGDHAGAVKQFARWDKAAGKPLKGLARRRAAEAELYAKNSGAAQDEPLRMPQAVDAPLEPTNAALKAKSRKFWLIDWLQKAVGGSFATGATVGLIDPGSMPSMLATMAAAIKAHGLIAIGIGAVLLFVCFSAMKSWMKEDVSSGRAVPSGYVS